MTSDKICDAISVGELRDCLDYRPTDGALIWKFRPDFPKQWNRRFAGQRAGSLNPSGYRRLGFHGRSIGEHRVVWAIVHGTWPNGLIDHVNGNAADNRIENLRIATSPQNSWNRACLGRCKTGSKGVVRIKTTGRFHASIMSHGVRRHLGSYPTLEEAEAAYAAAAAVLHGEFARSGGGNGVAADEVEIIRPPHPQQRRAAHRLRQIGEMYAAGLRSSAIIRLTKLSKPTVTRHLALIRAGAGSHWAEGSRVRLNAEGQR